MLATYKGDRVEGDLISGPFWDNIVLVKIYSGKQNERREGIRLKENCLKVFEARSRL